MSRLKQSTTNMFSSALGYAIPMLVNLFSTPFLLKELGNAAYGLNSIVAVIIGYLTFMDMGLDLPITKFLAEFKAKKDIRSQNRLLSTTLQLYLLIGVIGAIIIFLLSRWFAIYVFKIPSDLLADAILTFRIAGIGFIGSVGMSWGRALAMGLQRFEISYTISLSSSILGTLIGLIAVYFGYGVVGYVTSKTIFTVLSGPVYFFTTKKLLSGFKFKWGLDRELINKIKNYIGYGVFNRILSSLTSRIDQTLIGMWIGVAAAGIYAVPFFIMNSMVYMMSYMLGFTFPMASELHSLGQMDKLRDIYMRSSRFIAATAGLCFSLLFALGSSFFLLWTPTIAEEASKVFPLLCIAGYLNVVTASIPNNIIVGLGRIKEFVIYNSIRSIFFLISCLILIKPLGIAGAGWSLLITCTINIIYFYIVTTKYIGFESIVSFLRIAYFKPFVVTISTVVLASNLNSLATTWFGLILLSISIATVYIYVSFMLNIFGNTEKKALLSILSLLKKDRLK